MAVVYKVAKPTSSSTTNIPSLITPFTLISPNDPSISYTLQEKVGQGSFGVVYKAITSTPTTPTTSNTSDVVAIKVMNDMEDYEQELANLRKVTERCPPTARLVRLVEAFTIDQQHDHGGGGAGPTTTITTTTTTIPSSHYYLVMTPLARIDLEHLLTHDPSSYSLADIVRWSLDIAEALHALHREAKLYHGDVCPRNVLIGYDAHAYLADVGIAIHNHPYGNTEDSLVLYKKSVSVAPEMLEGNRVFDAAADVWSYGVLLEALLSRCLTRYIEDPDDVSSMHDFFLTLEPQTAAYEVWWQGIKPMWFEPSSADLATLIIRCACPAETRVALSSVISTLRQLLDGGSEGMSNEWEEMVSDCERQLAALEDGSTTNRREAGRICGVKGRAHMELGEYSQAESCMRRAVDLLRPDSQVAAQGGDHSAALVYSHIATDFAALLYHKGEYEQSLPFSEEALTMQRRLLPPDHPDTVTSINNLARLLTVVGEYDRALLLYEEALAMSRRALPDHPDTATSLNNLASLLHRMGQHDRALALYEEALAMLRRVMPPDHPTVATSLHNLASLLTSVGDTERALLLCEEALAMNRRLFPSDHPSTATSLSNLAMVLASVGEYDRAVALGEEALAIRLRVLPADHPKVSRSLDDLDELRGLQGKAR